jgi:NAD+ kinase
LKGSTDFIYISKKAFSVSSSSNKPIIAIYGKEVHVKHLNEIRFLLTYLLEKQVEVLVHKSYMMKLKKELEFDYDQLHSFLKIKSKGPKPVLLISIGGDGTFLDATALIRKTNIPILGINTGRLGFLARVSSENIKEAVDQFLGNEFEIEPRSLIEANLTHEDGEIRGVALNEVTIHKTDGTSMIIVHVYVNGEFLNSYWSDGLIISTPTGSSAYNLSVGGPIVAPGSRNFIISPIAPHNLNVRPIIISDNSELTIRVEGRTDKSILTIDSRRHRVTTDSEIRIKRAENEIKLVKFYSQSFFKTLRNKLHWGLDKRN